MFILNSSLLCLLIIYNAVSYVYSTDNFLQICNWNTLDYAYPDRESYASAVNNGDFIKEHNYPVGIEVWNDKLFITVPRWLGGVPSTLNYINIQENIGYSNSLLHPYPSWDATHLEDCYKSLFTVHRIKVDKCDRLWVLDTGTVGSGSNTTRLCPYMLKIFDLNTNELVHTYAFRTEDTNPDSFIENIAVEVGDSCDNAYAYLSDELGFGLIVYSLIENRSWRFRNKFFSDGSDNIFVGGLNIPWHVDGSFSMALSPRQRDGTRILHFSPLLSNKELTVSTSILHNSSKVEDSSKDFKSLFDRGGGRSTNSRIIDETSGIELFNFDGRHSIGCWNTGALPEKESIHEFEETDKALRYVSDITIDRHRNVWILSNRMRDFTSQSMVYDYANYRIYTTPFDILVEGTVCERKGDYNIGWLHQKICVS